MLIHKSFIIPLYSGDSKSTIHVIIADEKGWNKGADFINKYNDIHDSLFQFEEVAGYFTMTSKKGIERFWMVFKPTKHNMDTISHEITHCVNAICKSRGIKLDPDNDEAQCYLTGWVSKSTCSVLRKYIKL